MKVFLDKLPEGVLNKIFLFHSSPIPRQIKELNELLEDKDNDSDYEKPDDEIQVSFIKRLNYYHILDKAPIYNRKEKRAIIDAMKTNDEVKILANKLTRHRFSWVGWNGL